MLIASMGVLSLTWGVFQTTEIDLWLQNLFYLSPNTWVIDTNSPIPRMVFYTGIKGVIIVFGVGAFLAFLWSFKEERFRPWRRKLALIFLSLSVIPLTVAGSKKVTNIFCPAELERFGAQMPYVKLFDRMPFQTDRRGHCYPAGHPSGGFALMSLFFVFRERRSRLRGLFVGLAVGWTMGLYQMAKGAHFLSHNVVTMEIAWIWILVLHGCLFASWNQRLWQNHDEPVNLEGKSGLTAKTAA